MITWFLRESRCRGVPSKAEASDSFASGSHARVRCFRTLEFYWIRRHSARQRTGRHASFSAKALNQTRQIRRNGRAEAPARSRRIQQKSKNLHAREMVAREGHPATRQNPKRNRHRHACLLPFLQLATPQ